MGLDFGLVKKRKEDPIEVILGDNVNELAYGRKSWELVYKLASAEDIDNGYGILKRENWESLMRDLDPVGDLLQQIWDAFDHEENAPKDYPEYIFTEEDKKLIAQYEYWYDRTFSESPVLGYQFSVSYMKEFYDAKSAVRAVLDDPDYEVGMYISY